MQYSGARVLVTGGLGFIGSNLVVRLVDLGAEVVIFDSAVEGCGANSFNIDPVRDRVRQALSARLIRWGEQLRVPTPPVEVRP